MSFTSNDNGRLCNQIFRNFAVSKIAEKHDLHVDYSNIDLINQFTELGKSIFHEIDTLTHIQQDLNHGTINQPGVPNNLPGPPPFNAPKL